jgi:lupus La protein
LLDVSVATLLTFKRLEKLTTKSEDVMNAVKESDILVVDESAARIRRKVPFVATATYDAGAKTIHVKRFDENATIEQVRALFEGCGDITSIRLRYRVVTEQGKRVKKYKGSAEVEFSTEEAAEKACKLEGLKWDKDAEKDLIVSPFVAWAAAKKERLAAKALKKNEGKSPAGKNGSSKAEEEEEEGADGGAAKAESETFISGLIVDVQGISGDNITRFTIKDLFAQSGTVAFVEFENGDSTARIRYHDATCAAEAVKRCKEEAWEMEGNVVTASLLEGAEEHEYWHRAFERKRESSTRDKRGDSNKRKRGGGRGGRGGRGGKRGRR